jgi:hypothetical protein
VCGGNLSDELSMVRIALGIEANILFIPQGKKIVAESPTHRGTPLKIMILYSKKMCKLVNLIIA